MRAEWTTYQFRIYAESAEDSELLGKLHEALRTNVTICRLIGEARETASPVAITNEKGQCLEIRIPA